MLYWFFFISRKKMEPYRKRFHRIIGVIQTIPSGLKLLSCLTLKSKPGIFFLHRLRNAKTSQVEEPSYMILRNISLKLVRMIGLSITACSSFVILFLDSNSCASSCVTSSQSGLRAMK